MATLTTTSFLLSMEDVYIDVLSMVYMYSDFPCSSVKEIFDYNKQTFLREHFYQKQVLGEYLYTMLSTACK